jgi:hypothetical protein
MRSGIKFGISTTVISLLVLCAVSKALGAKPDIGAIAVFINEGHTKISSSRPEDTTGEACRFDVKGKEGSQREDERMFVT